ncbi:LpqG protein [Streptomyces alboflavus]|uniref:LpqG protein n=1 Tax=Streptomyces alboflavus TaxID=67267 RepID=A0A1Z1WN68_9ACTN|nr:SIMPL domain-containing protein [Streptomyces alboflavus]ARX87848.1 LpqG protein [Streptomyces alboflavus]
MSAAPRPPARDGEPGPTAFALAAPPVPRALGPGPAVGRVRPGGPRTGAPARSPRSRTSLRVLTAAVVALGLSSAPASPAAALAVSAPAPAVANPTPTPSTVTVTGTGSASAVPDLAVVGMAVEVTAPTAEKALAAQHAAANALLGALRGQQVAERDVRTDSLELSAVYEDGGGGGGGTSKLTGYRAAQSFSVKVREPRRTGRVIKAAVAAAGDAVRVNGVTFDLADARPLRAKAREAAHEDARSKAEHYAALTGRELGRLVSLTEAESGNPRPLTVSPSAFAKQEGVLVAPGEIQDSVSVVAVYELQ